MLIDLGKAHIISNLLKQLEIVICELCKEQEKITELPKGKLCLKVENKNEY